MSGEFFEDRELERELLDEFPTPLADLFDDLTYERSPRGRLAKVIDLFRVTVRLLAYYALAATAAPASGGYPELPPEALVRLRKLIRQRISEGDWLGLARETVRPFARTPAPFPIAEVAAVFFRPGTDQPAPGAAALERLLKTRNEWAHGVSGSEAEIEAIVDQCRPDLETMIELMRWTTQAPWFVPDAPAAGTVVEGRRLMGTTPRRGFRSLSIPAEEALEPGGVYSLAPTGALRLDPLVQFLAPPEDGPSRQTPDAREDGLSVETRANDRVGTRPGRTGDWRLTSGDSERELFLLEAGGRREAHLLAFPSGREAGSRAAQEWLQQRAALPDEPEERGPRFDVPMIDRTSECEEFRRLLRRVTEERRGQVLVIDGEAGIGKTKFVRFCREAGGGAFWREAGTPRREGDAPGGPAPGAPLPIRVMHGSYRDHAGGAYAGFREALEDLFGVEMLERDAAASRIAAALPELGYGDNAAEAADLAQFLTQFLRPVSASGEAGREGLDYVVGRLERFLRRVSLHVPLLLLLEDIHWADAESLALLQHLSAVLATDPARLLIIATMRGDDREPNPALESALQKMARFEGTVYRRTFSRLGEMETATLIEESLQAELEEKAAIYRLAEGNPLHVLSIIRYLSSEALLEPTERGWRVSPGVPLTEILPTTVREVIGLRVKRLAGEHPDGPERRETLIWAAVAGRRFDAGVLADAIQAGAPHLSARLDAHLDALVEAGLLRECSGLPGDMLEFDHHLLREVVLAEREGPRAERARHRCLAAAKLRRIEHGELTLLPEVAHHFLEAREWTEATRYHLHAGEAASRALAFREAAGLYDVAVRLLREHSTLSLTADERARLFEAQAETLETLGRADEALAAYQAAQQEAKEDRIRWARSQRSIAWLLSRKGRLDEAAAACDQARELLEAAGAEPVLAEVLRTLGVIEILRGRYEAALRDIQRALEIYQRSEPSEGLARCYAYLAQIYHDRGDLEAMLEATEHSRMISEQLGDPVSIGHALNNVAWVLVLLGRDEEALPLLFRAAEIFDRHEILIYLPNVYHSLAEALLKCGRAEEARGYLERGLESARRVGEVRTVADFHHLLARQAAATGREEEARLQFEQALCVCGGTGLEPQQAQIGMEYGDFLRRIGDREGALHRYEAALAIRRGLGGEGIAEAEEALARVRRDE